MCTPWGKPDMKCAGPTSWLIFINYECYIDTYYGCVQWLATCVTSKPGSSLSQIVDGTKKFRIESEAEVRVFMLADWYLIGTTLPGGVLLFGPYFLFIIVDLLLPLLTWICSSSKHINYDNAHFMHIIQCVRRTASALEVVWIGREKVSSGGTSSGIPLLNIQQQAWVMVSCVVLFPQLQVLRQASCT